MYSFKTQDFLHKVALGLDKAQTIPELKVPLAAYGYDDKGLVAGVKLHEKVITLQADQGEARSLAKEATATFQQAREGMESLYRRHVAIARFVFEEDSVAWEKLQLDGKRQRTIAGIQWQAKMFYTHLLDDYVEAVALLGLSKKEIQESIKLLDNLVSLQSLQEQAKKRSQTLTQMKNEALENLVVWWRRFTKSAQLALESQPQYLETLNLG
ncbi:MAG: hypothetical protein ACFB15_12610 [Cyclobacteriaceae bacterium]